MTKVKLMQKLLGKGVSLHNSNDESSCIHGEERGIEINDIQESDPQQRLQLQRLSEVVGFLEVCKVRLDVLIKSGQAGILCDELLKHVLYVNVAVQKALDAERYGMKSFSF